MNGCGPFTLFALAASLAAAACGAPTPIPTATPVPEVETPVPSPSPTAQSRPVPGPTKAEIATLQSVVVATPTPPPVPTVRPVPIAVDRATGDQAPHFELALFDGESLSLEGLRGKIVVLNFWASWCPPCKWEMPAFEEMWKEYRDQGVVFVGVAVSDEERLARDFATKTGITYPLGLDSIGTIARDYRAYGLPTTFIIDREGNEIRKFGVANEAVLRLFLKGQIGDG